MINNRRWNPRKPITIEVTLSYPQSEKLNCQTRDISLEGMSIDTGRVVVPENTLVDILVKGLDAVVSDQYRFPAVVVRATKNGVGTVFRNMGFDNFRALQSILL